MSLAADSIKINHWVAVYKQLVCNLQKIVLILLFLDIIILYSSISLKIFI